MRDFCGIVDGRRIEEQRSHKRSLFRGFQQGIEMIAAGPVVMFDLTQETVEQHPGGVAGIDPGVRKRLAERLAERLEVQREHEQVLFRSFGGGSGRLGIGRCAWRIGGRRGVAQGSAAKRLKIVLQRSHRQFQVPGGCAQKLGAGHFAFGGGDEFNMAWATRVFCSGEAASGAGRCARQAKAIAESAEARTV